MSEVIFLGTCILLGVCVGVLIKALLKAEHKYVVPETNGALSDLTKAFRTVIYVAIAGLTATGVLYFLVLFLSYQLITR